MFKMKDAAILSLALFSFVSLAMSQDIFEAVKSGNLEKAKALIDKDPGLVNRQDDRSRRPLHIASEGGYKEIAKLLLEKGAEIDARDINKNTPLLSAMIQGKTEIAELLIANGADMNAQEYRGYAPLHFAAQFNNEPLTGLLIEKGAKVDLKENRGLAPLHLSSRNGNLNMVRLLVGKGADINGKIEGTWVTPMSWAAENGFREVVDYLIDQGAVVDEKHRFLFRFSVSQGLEKLFKILYEKGADPNIRTNNGGTILHSAAEGGSPEILRILIDKAFDPNQPDRYGWTPLHYAAYNGRKNAVDFLIGREADINKRNLSGESAWNIASEKGLTEISQFLASKVADRSPQKFPILEGEYLGQKKPGKTPEVFALDIVSSPEIEHGNVAFSPDGKTMYWTGGYRMVSDKGARGFFKVLTSRLEKNRWTPPQYAFFTKDVSITDDVPFVSPDGKRLIFMSKRPLEPGGSEDRENYWLIDKTETGWSEPKPIDEVVRAMTIRWQISISASGTLYFGASDVGGIGQGDIYMSRLVEGKYSKPENLGDLINSKFDETAPFIAPDESYLIFGREARGNEAVKDGLYIAFKDKAGKWMTPVYMGDEINSGGAGFPSVSPDGRYLFFNSGRNGNYDIYWIDAKIIDELRPKESK